MISVVITVDNEVIGLSETLYFALHALLRADVEFEVIVSCGISEDWSETFARHWIHEHQGIVHGQVIGQEWQGLAHALNLGWRQARGDFVLFAEAGVNWGEDHVVDLLALQSEYPTAHLLSAAWKEVDINDNEVIHTLGIGCDKRGQVPCFFKAQATGSPIARISTVAVPRWALEHIDGFPEGVKSNEDAATIAFAKLALIGPMAYSPSVSVTHFLDEKTHNDQPNDYLAYLSNLSVGDVPVPARAGLRLAQDAEAAKAAGMMTTFNHETPAHIAAMSPYCRQLLRDLRARLKVASSPDLNNAGAVCASRSGCAK